MLEELRKRVLDQRLLIGRDPLRQCKTSCFPQEWKEQGAVTLCRFELGMDGMLGIVWPIEEKLMLASALVV